MKFVGGILYNVTQKFIYLRKSNNNFETSFFKLKQYLCCRDLKAKLDDIQTAFMIHTIGRMSILYFMNEY